MVSVWCHVCCTRHGNTQECPGELEATGVEKRSWRINVDAGSRIEAFGVLIAPSHDLWRARIFTYPGALWIVPGGNATMKFIGDSAEQAEAEAIRFVREFCEIRGYRPRAGAGDEAEAMPGPQRTAPPPRSPEPALADGVDNRRHPRLARFHRVRFGTRVPNTPGGSGDLSESGLFVMTDEPLETGSSVNLLFELPQGELPLYGTVRWVRRHAGDGRAAGMGIQLDSPGDGWLAFVRSL